MFILLDGKHSHEEVIELLFGWIGQFKLRGTETIGYGTGTLTAAAYLVEFHLPGPNHSLLRQSIDLLKSLQLKNNGNQFYSKCSCDMPLKWANIKIVV